MQWQWLLKIKFPNYKYKYLGKIINKFKFANSQLLPTVKQGAPKFAILSLTPNGFVVKNQEVPLTKK